jgi:hypothetical protein
MRRRGGGIRPKAVAEFHAASPDGDGERPDDAGEVIRRGIVGEVRDENGRKSDFSEDKPIGLDVNGSEMVSSVSTAQIHGCPSRTITSRSSI